MGNQLSACLVWTSPLGIKRSNFIHREWIYGLLTAESADSDPVPRELFNSDWIRRPRGVRKTAWSPLAVWLEASGTASALCCSKAVIFCNVQWYGVSALLHVLCADSNIFNMNDFAAQGVTQPNLYTRRPLGTPGPPHGWHHGLNAGPSLPP